jgi:chitinase
MSAFAGIWGGYLPIIDALRDSLDVLQVQLYNSGSMYGVDNNVYNSGTADFITSQTEAVIYGFNTAGGAFNGLPANKVAVGLPACTNRSKIIDRLSSGNRTQPGFVFVGDIRLV